MKSVADTTELLMLMEGSEFYLCADKSQEFLPAYSEILAMMAGLF